MDRKSKKDTTRSKRSNKPGFKKSITVSNTLINKNDCPTGYNFMGVFDAFKLRKKFLSSNNPEINQIELSIDNYNIVINKLLRTGGMKFFEDIVESNPLDKIELFQTISEFIKSDLNVLLYGIGSKLRLIYDFLIYFQQYENNNSSLFNSHIIVVNGFNPEITVKFILEHIKTYITSFIEEDSSMIKKSFEKCSTFEEQIEKLAYYSKHLKLSDEFKGRFLLVLNNIDGPNFLNKAAQKSLSSLISNVDVKILATTDNLYIPYYWSQNVKDNYSFYFLRYHTFERMDVEISDKHSLTGEKSVKSGVGLSQIMKSLTNDQKNCIKSIAKYQRREENACNKLTMKELTRILIDDLIVTNANQVNHLLDEPKDHDLVIERTLKDGKVIYKLNLEIDVIDRIISGEYDN